MFLIYTAIQNILISCVYKIVLNGKPTIIKFLKKIETINTFNPNNK